MIDFCKHTFKLSEEGSSRFSQILNGTLTKNEKVLIGYQSIRDGLVFTNQRIIAVDIQGVTGNKKSLLSIPYERIQVYAVETAGFFDLDGELDIWVSGIGCIHFEFTTRTSMSKISGIISDHIFPQPITNTANAEHASSIPDKIKDTCPKCGRKYHNKRTHCFECNIELV